MRKLHNRRNTRQRQVIVEELRLLDTHPTAAELYAVVRKRLPRISLGTVYRNLNLLTEAGIVRRLDRTGEGARYDCDPEPHHHVRCLRCGKVWNFQDIPPELPGQELEQVEGYEILGYRIELIGYCPRCRKGEAGQAGLACSDTENRSA